MYISLKFSGLFRILAGEDQAILDVVEGTTIRELTGLLAERFKNLPLEAKGTHIIINGQVPTHNQALAEGDQVRVFQMLAGG